jgi:hypothetical protein
LHDANLDKPASPCCCCCCCQVIDYYRSKVVKLEAEQAPDTVSKQIREALSKIQHSED